MLLAVVDGARAQYPEAEVRVFSPYPKEDRGTGSDFEIIDFRPSDMVLRVFPAAIVSLLTQRRWKPKRGPGGALAASAVVADVSGISFMDGRGFATLVYNVLIVLLPWAFGVPTIKVAQALGPFHTRLNRIAARLVLPRVKWIGLRGAETAAYAQDLGLNNGQLAADVAFLLQTGSAAEEQAASIVPADRTITIVAPSAVLEAACRENSIDYVARVSRLVTNLQDSGHRVVLLAHSARHGKGEGHTNDLPTVRRIAQQTRAELIDDELDARQLRAVIGRARLLVTSRFHAMISGLATITPTFVIGWSHKYGEVLAEFGLEDWAIDFRDLDDDDLFEAVRRLDGSAASVREAIESRLPEVRDSARLSIDELLSTLRSEEAWTSTT
jgi:polysaccharide pyruvyl transferase WcaK-like protein